MLMLTHQKSDIIIWFIILILSRFSWDILSATESSAISYIAFALSDDNRMPRASVIECVHENNAIRSYTSFTHDHSGSPRINVINTIWYFSLFNNLNKTVGSINHKISKGPIQWWKDSLFCRTWYRLNSQSDDIQFKWKPFPSSCKRIFTFTEFSW